MTPNTPTLFLPHLPIPSPDGNKYTRGHAVILGGPLECTGAARIAAKNALRIGAGLVSIACDAASLPIYAAACEAVMVKPIASIADFAELIADERVTSVLLGPGVGVNAHTKACVEAALLARQPCVLDADAMSVFEHTPQLLFDLIEAPCILTPHEGEFARLFGAVHDRATQAVEAARRSGAVVVLKGFETIIAAPDGRVALNQNATPYLATAGSGDALAGMCTGLLAQGMPAFEAACAAVWIHAEAGRNFGAGLIAEDIEHSIPGVLHSLTLRL